MTTPDETCAPDPRDGVPVQGDGSAFSVACPFCRQPVGHTCRFSSDALGLFMRSNNFVHVARAVAGGVNARKATAEAADLQAKADAALLADARCLPAGVLARVAAVLRHGAVKYGAASPAETGGGQTAEDHAAHGFLHAMNADRDLMERDPETGEVHAIHAACRMMLAAGGGGK